LVDNLIERIEKHERRKKLNSDGKLLKDAQLCDKICHKPELAIWYPLTFFSAPPRYLKLIHPHISPSLTEKHFYDEYQALTGLEAINNCHFGINFLLYITYLRFVMNLTYNKIATLPYETYRAEASKGTVVECIKRGARGT